MTDEQQRKAVYREEILRETALFIFSGLIAAQNSRPSYPNDMSTLELAEQSFHAAGVFEDVAEERIRQLHAAAKHRETIKNHPNNTPKNEKMRGRKKKK